MVLATLIHAGHIQDRDGARLLLTEELKELLPDIEILWADSGYSGEALAKEVQERLGWLLEVVRREGDGNEGAWVAEGEEPPPRKRGFVMLKWRWIVERTSAWLSRFRRLAKDWEATLTSSRAWLQIGMVHLMLRRLTA